MSEAHEVVEQEAPVVENEVVETTETVEAAPEAVESSESVEAAPETTEELQEAVEEAIEEGATQEEVANMIKEFELKVNGRTLNKKIDLSDEDALKKELQLAAAGRQSMQELAEIKKLYTQEIERLKQDPFAVLEELGLNGDELAELRLQQRIEEMKKSPEQIEREKIQAELEQARKQLQAEKERAEQAEMARLREQAAIQLDEEISAALEAHQSLPNSAYTVKKIADMMLWAIDNGWDDVTVNDVVPSVEAEIRNEISEMFDNLPETAMESYLGKKNIERMRNKRLAQMKTVENTSNVKKTVGKPKEEKPREKIKIDDWMRI
jgi:vacuolar-type H+-ATPase subunit I/STV1